MIRLFSRPGCLLNLAQPAVLAACAISMNGGQGGATVAGSYRAASSRCWQSVAR